MEILIDDFVQHTSIIVIPNRVFERLMMIYAASQMWAKVIRSRPQIPIYLTYKVHLHTISTSEHKCQGLLRQNQSKFICDTNHYTVIS